MGERRAYPAFIKQDASTFLVYIPDLEIYTEGTSFPDAIVMARDAIGMKWLDANDDGRNIPQASTAEEAIVKAKEDADEDFDYSDGILTFVDIDCDLYRIKYRNRSVKKNCTIPYWLNEEAEKKGVNFSKVLQEALIQSINAN